MDIVEVAKLSGIPASTLRYYEQKGLIQSVGRRGLRRLFSPQVLDQLALIALGRAAGFSLDEIAGMLLPESQPQIDRTLLHSKADEMDRTIKKLSAIRDVLRRAAECPATHHLECSKFRQLMRIAGSGGFGLTSKKGAYQRGKRARISLTQKYIPMEL